MANATKLPRLPLPAGRWVHRRDGMVCRLPLRKLRISAPSSFLRAVEDSCDGKTEWVDVQAKLSARWSASEVEACLRMLVCEGVLVEASHSLALHAEVGWSPQPLAPSTDRSDLHALRQGMSERLHDPAPGPRLRPQSTPFLQSACGLRSARTFGDGVLRLQSLVNILWAIYGVVREEDEQRVGGTVPSGGALHGLRWFVALLNPSDAQSAGLYAVSYHAERKKAGSLSLEPCTGFLAGTWSTLLTPSVLSLASAVVYPVADIELLAQQYGNRALTLATIEAGRALQNAALAALQEGAATSVRGDTVEMEVLSLFGLDRPLYPLPALVLGVDPTPRQEELERRSSERVLVRTVPNHSLQLPLATRVAVAGPIEIGRKKAFRMWATGRSEDAGLAAVKAEAEAWERIGWATPGALVRARLDELEGAVDPRVIVAYDEQQYRRTDFPYAPWSGRRRYPWAAATRIRDGAQAWMMAQCVHALSSLRPGDARRPYTNASTSGIAAFTDPASARERALLELIERDAFARAWLMREAPPAIDEQGLAASLQRRLACLRAAGYGVCAHLLPSALLAVVAVFAQRRAASFTCVTTGAAFDLEGAMESALAETESRIQQSHNRPPLAPIRINEVSTAGHHGDYFRTRAGFRTADWFAASHERVSLGTLPHATEWSPTGPRLFDRLLAQGREVYVCDLTPPGAAVDQGRTPLHVARVFVTGLLPLWFGDGTEPLGLEPAARFARSDRQGLIHPCT